MKIELDVPDYNSDMWFFELGLSLSHINNSEYNFQDYNFEDYNYLFSIGLLFFSINIKF